ncbi:phosphatase PAP2 family protein [Azohydromonas caseinilytica]|uniref:Phosphatase PAP2 family protein n=1 Tax=Azohydromonas caseinilytica TaxID=2728836 RepID=A0A848F1I7_9BURK|nr:phosphatase PAP2 family protein [Azohydromonas caseinilytica]NML13937.1 phosphatase PAP2 family protein [Azohydromonas caseinilytica]
MSEAFWNLLTRLGEAQILLPAMLATSLWLMLRSHKPRAALVWWACTAVAALLTTLTKLAFFGWEIGYAPLNYTGISGHAMFSTAVLPVLLRVLVADRGPRRQAAAMGVGIALAALIAWSRVQVMAHSPVEAVLGFALGLAAAVAALRVMHAPPLHAPRTLVLGLAAWMLLTPAGAPPSQTHSWVTRLSVALSGRAEPYSRWDMLHAYRQDLQRRGQPLPPFFSGPMVLGRMRAME